MEWVETCVSSACVSRTHDALYARQQTEIVICLFLVYSHQLSVLHFVGRQKTIRRNIYDHFDSCKDSAQWNLLILKTHLGTNHKGQLSLLDVNEIDLQQIKNCFIFVLFIEEPYKNITLR